MSALGGERRAVTDRLTVVVLTYQRPEELHRSLTLLTALPEHPPIIVVDNGVGDGTRERVSPAFPKLRWLALAHNAGAAGRNAGVEHVPTPYIAFCDDDTWWAPGALEAAVGLLDRHPDVAVLSARVLVGTEAAEDPVCTLMAASPLPAAGLPGPALMGFLAGACVMRRSAFLEAGGYEPALFLGGEEALLAMDLWALGWSVVYAPQLTAYHHPSQRRDRAGRRRLLLRNALLVAWLRRPAWVVWCKTWYAVGQCLCHPGLIPGLLQALARLSWALQRRRVVPGAVESWCRLVERNARGLRPPADPRVPGGINRLPRRVESGK